MGWYLVCRAKPSGAGMNRKERRRQGGVDSSLRDRFHLFKYNKELARLLGWLRAKPSADSVVVIVDANDLIGQALAAVAAQQMPSAPQDLAQIERGGKRPTLILTMSRQECARFLAEVNPNVARALHEPAPQGRIWCVVSCSGGTTLTMMDEPTGVGSAGTT